jgi:hypothetical protein
MPMRSRRQGDSGKSSPEPFRRSDRQKERIKKEAEVRPWRKILLLVGSTEVFAAAGFVWIEVTRVGGGGLYCPPGPLGKQPPCVVIHESWPWMALGLVLGSISGAVLAVVINLVVRVKGRYGHGSSTVVSSPIE